MFVYGELSGHTNFGSIGVEIEGHEGGGKLIAVAVTLPIFCDGLLELLLAHVAPGTDIVGDDLNVKLRHFARFNSSMEVLILRTSKPYTR